MTSTSYRWGDADVILEIPSVMFTTVSGGSSYEDRVWAGTTGQVMKWYYKGLKKFWPPAKLNDAFVNGDRDPITNEYRDRSVKFFQSAEAVIDAAGISRAPFIKDGLKKLGESQLKRIIDWGAEEIMKIGSEQLGLGNQRTMVLGYYMTKYAYEGSTGRISEIFKLVEALIKTGTKGADAIKELERNGLNLNMPKDKNEVLKVVFYSEKIQTPSK